MAAFIFYLGVSLALWGFPTVLHLTATYAGVGKADAHLYVWVLYWWPCALLHGLDPLHSAFVWAPAGVNMTWVTGMPGPALLLWPITETLGPIASLNVLLLLSPPLAAWSAYLLTSRLTRSFWAGLAGGYVFGFSTYEVAQMHGHADLVLMFLVALSTYLVARRLEGSLGRVAFVLVLTLALVGQFSVSTEVFATMTLFGGVALLGALMFGPRDRRRAVLATAGLIGIAYVVTALIASPYLVRALSSMPQGPIRVGNTVSADLGSFVVPRSSTWVGGGALQPLSRRFAVSVVEDGAYLGLFLLVILLFAVTRWRSRATWLLLAFIAVAALASLGPVLRVFGTPTVELPWRLAAQVPLLRDVVPARLTLYVWLATAVIVALWLAHGKRRLSWVRWVLFSVAAVSLLPVTTSPPYHPPVRIPAFFTSGEYERYLLPGEIVLPIPGETADEMLWQVEAGMYFRLARGYVGVPPSVASSGRSSLANATIAPNPGVIGRFIRAHHVGAILLADAAAGRWKGALETLGVTPVDVGGIYVYRLSGRTPGAIVSGVGRVADPRVSHREPEHGPC